MAPSSKATAKPAKKAQKAAAAPAAKSSAKSAAGRSTERIADSDLESDSEAESADEKASSGTSSSGGEESGESSSGTSSSGSDSDSESDSDAEDLPAVVTVPKKSSKPSGSTPAKPTTSAPPPPFAPPKGFTPLPPTAAAPLATTVFSPSALGGKQIWYITAPASLPLHALTSVSLPAVLAGQPVLTHRGQDYGFIRDDAGAAPTHTHILVPAPAARQRGWPAYAECARGVDQTLHLQQLVELPGLVAEAAGRATVPAKARPGRVQPQGLRMRFRPMGFGEGATGEIGEEESEEEAGPVFKKHKAAAVGEEEEGRRKKQKGEKSEKHKGEKSEKKRKDKRTASS